MAESTNDSWSPVYSAGSEDQDFDPSAEMLVHEFDDERTLEEEEEEARESEHNFSSEVEDLEKEGEMPLEELLALYGYGAPLTAAALPGGASPESDLPDNLPEMTLDKEEIAKDLLSGEDDESQSSADDLMPSVISNGTQDIFGCSFQLDTEMDGNEGTDFSDEDECVAAEERKTVMVGSQYQAIIPAGLFRYQADSGPADEAQWDPCVLPESQVLLYLREAAEGGVAPAPSSRCREGPAISVLLPPLLPPGTCPDDDHALRELMACNYDTREALARLRLAPAPPRDEMHKWTDEERLKFEEGFRLHYKDFHVIHTLVGTKSVAECVAFYYVWKKSRRLEFMQQSRMGKRKASLQPGLGDGVELEAEGSARSLAPLLAGGSRRERVPGDDGHAAASVAAASVAADLAVQVLESLSSSDLGLTCTDMLLLRGGGGSRGGCSGGDGIVVSPSGSPAALGPFLTAVLDHPAGGSWDGTSAESSCLPLADGGPSTPDSVAHSTTSSSVGEDQEVPAKRLKLELYGDGSLSADAGGSSSSSSSSSSSLSAEGSEPAVRLALDLGAVETAGGGRLLSAHVLRHPPPAASEPCSQ